MLTDHLNMTMTVDWGVLPQTKKSLRLSTRCDKTGPEVIKLISKSTQLSTKLILPINVKMPTIIGILTFMSIINTTLEKLKARNVFICRYLSFYEEFKFRVQLS